MMKSLHHVATRGPVAVAVALAATIALVAPARAQVDQTVFQVTLGEQGQLTPEISTEELQQILASGSEPVLDVRSALEYAIAHIPGAVNISELEVALITAMFPDRATPMILVCNGPFCGKSKRTSEQLVATGYLHVRRYQLGLPVWRALGNTVQTDLDGLLYITRGDDTAILVDARTPQEFLTRTMRCAVNIQRGEATAANDDGRLPKWDKGTRVVVFADAPEAAQKVAAEIARKAYWNSSYFGGSLADLRRARLLRSEPGEECPARP
jgi:rhodanese-related sulfurtransferase